MNKLEVSVHKRKANMSGQLNMNVERTLKLYINVYDVVDPKLNDKVSSRISFFTIRSIGLDWELFIQVWSFT